MATGKTPFEVETKLDAGGSGAYKRHAHHWLILHGRYTCVARKPLCEKCIISDLCRWPGKTVYVKSSWESAYGRLRHGKTRQSRALIPMGCFERAGLPVKCGTRVAQGAACASAATSSAMLPPGGNIWRAGADLIAKLPGKSKRNAEQKLAADIIISACRQARRISRPTTPKPSIASSQKILPNFVRVDELAYEAAKLVPGLTPTRKQVDAESASMQSEKDGVEVDQGIFLAQVLAVPSTGMHLCQAMLLPKPEAIERGDEFVKHGVIDFGPARVERQGKAAVVTVKNPRFLNAEDDDTLDDTETAADIAILDPMSEICVLRGDVVDHPKYRGRKIFSAGINLTHLYRGKIPYLWYIRRDMGVVNKMFRGLAMGRRQSRRNLRRHA